MKDFTVLPMSFGTVFRTENDINEFNKLKFNDHPVGSGPFRFVGWRKDDELVLEAPEKEIEATAALVFAQKEPLGYVSDHIGLRARLSLTPIPVRATPRPGA